jgi:putative spermidine/putrescine transport system permease protein
MRTRRGHATSLHGALGVMPLLAFLAAAFYFPLASTIAGSLHVQAGGAFGFANYGKFLGSHAGLETLALTLLLSLAATVLAVGLSLPLALALRRPFRGKGTILFLMMLPIIIPTLVGALGLLILYDRAGWINFFLVRVLHVLKQPLLVDYTIPGLVIFYLWMFFPYGALVILSGASSIDPALEEAGAVMGARPLLMFRRVLLPLLRPSLLAGAIMIFLQCFGAFSVPLIAGGDHQPIAVRIYTVATVFLDWNGASAMAVVMGVIQCVLVIAYQRMNRAAAGGQQA